MSMPITMAKPSENNTARGMVVAVEALRSAARSVAASLERPTASTTGRTAASASSKTG